MVSPSSQNPMFLSILLCTSARLLLLNAKDKITKVRIMLNKSLRLIFRVFRPDDISMEFLLKSHKRPIPVQSLLFQKNRKGWGITKFNLQSAYFQQLLVT